MGEGGCRGHMGVIIPFSEERRARRRPAVKKWRGRETLTEQSIDYNIINLTEVFGYMFGIILMSIAFFRVKIIPSIFALFLAIAIIIRFTLAGFYATTVLSDILYTTAFASIGLLILKMSDEDWTRL